MDSPASLLMLDPSIVFSNDVLAWLEEDQGAGARAEVILSTTLLRWLTRDLDLDLYSAFAPDDLENFGERRDRLAELFGDVTAFSFREANLGDEARDVLSALLDSGDPAAEIYADEWAFLQAHSFLGAKLRRPLELFRDAGSAVLEFGAKARDYLIREVIPPEHVPQALTTGFIAKVTVKWVVLGGASIGGGTIGGLAGGSVGAAAGHILGHTAAQAVVVAIDP